MGDRVSREEVERANSIHVLDYLESKGEGLKKEGKYYRHTKHDSLVVHENGKWYWNSRSEGGYGAISLARKLYDLSFQDAVRDVNNQGISLEQQRDRRIQNRKEKREFKYPHQYESSTQYNIKEYLTNKRSLETRTVEALIKKGYVAEDKLKNCVFKWIDKGKIVGADRQGTVKMKNGNYFKQIVANSKEDGGFQFDVGVPNKIAVFESPIDAISYYDLFKPNDIRLKSMSGLKDRTFATALKDFVKECNEKNIKIKKVIIAVDNDQAGEEFSKKWTNMIGSSERHKPITKDWNMDLQQRRVRERQRLKERINEIEIGR